MTAERDSSATTSIDKEQVRADLIAHLRGEESSTDSSLEARDEAVAAPDGQERRADDDSQRDEADDQRAALQENDAAQLALISLAKGLDMSPTQVVQPGAIVTLDGTSYVVGVPTDEFTSGERRSRASPPTRRSINSCSANAPVRPWSWPAPRRRSTRWSEREPFSSWRSRRRD